MIRIETRVSGIFNSKRKTKLVELDVVVGLYTVKQKRRIINGKRVFESATRHKPFEGYFTTAHTL